MRGWIIALAVLGAGCGSDPGDDWVAVGGVPDGLFAINDVWSFAPDDVWAVASGGTVLRFDGVEWNSEQAPVQANLTGIWALSPTDIWVCGDTSILHYDGSAWAVVDDTEQHGLDGLTSIWASSGSDVWVVGDDAIAVHYDGTTTTRTLIPSTFNTHVFGTGPNDVYALGVFELVHYDGTEWTVVDTGIGGGEGEVWGTGPNDIWLAPDSFELAHFDGSSWEIVETDFVGDIAALWGTSSDDIWGAGGFGAIAHFNGDKWTQVQSQKIGSPQLRQFFAVHASSPTDAWAVGQVLDDQGARPIVRRYEP